MLTIDQLDRLGRPLLRLVGVGMLAITGVCVGIGIGWAFIAWGVFHIPMPPLPGETLLLAALPFVTQWADQITRFFQKRSDTHAWTAVQTSKQVPFIPNPERGMAT